VSEFDDWEELGPPEIRPVPGAGTRAKSALIAAAVIVGGVLLVAAGAWAIMRQGGSKPAATPASVEATNVTESFPATGASSPESTSAVTTSTAGSSTTTPPPRAGRWIRAARVAYRSSGALWVSDESGGNARKVIVSAEGAFSLSPDGRTLAVIGGSRGPQLVLVDVGTSRATTVGPADLATPVWAPSSAWLAYGSGQDTEVRRVDRGGRNVRFLGSGSDPAIGPDAASYVFITPAGRIAYSKSGSTTKELKPKGPVDALALTADRVFYSLGATLPAGLEVRSMKIDGTGDRRLVGAPSDPKAGRYDDFLLSGDATWLVYTIAGDEKYSRMHAVRTGGSRDVGLSPRRDGYPLRWSADYTRILFIDGNALQGESTQLKSVRPDGTSPRILLTGAGL